MLADWDDMITGRGCPLCAPRPDRNGFHFLVRRLSASSLYLARNQHYRGTCALIFDLRHVNRIGELDRIEWQRLASDLWLAESALMQALRPDHMNVESLGNTVPHLHWHLIPRYRDDGRWGGPIWTTRQEDQPNTRLAEDEFADIASRILSAIEAIEVSTRDAL